MIGDILHSANERRMVTVRLHGGTRSLLSSLWDKKIKWVKKVPFHPSPLSQVLGSFPMDEVLRISWENLDRTVNGSIDLVCGYEFEGGWSLLKVTVFFLSYCCCLKTDRERWW